MTQEASRPASKQATIYDVARAAGVSHQTVSRYLKGDPTVRPAMRERVQRALLELDYRPNWTARALATSRSHRIAALTHEISQIGPSWIAQGAAAGARKAGYFVDILSVDMGDHRSVREAAQLVLKQDFAGVLALASTDESRRAFEASRFPVPTLIEVEPEDYGTHPSRSASSRGVSMAIEHLADLGHRYFFHVAGPANWIPARNRELAYQRRLELRGLVSLGVARGDWSAASGYTSAASIPPGTTAVVVANDQMALGVILFLAEQGVRVPKDISVIGYDDIPEAAYFNPPLTTVRQDLRSYGETLFRQLQARIEELPGPADLVKPTELIVRSSTASAPL